MIVNKEDPEAESKGLRTRMFGEAKRQRESLEWKKIHCGDLLTRLAEFVEKHRKEQVAPLVPVDNLHEWIQRERKELLAVKP